MIWLIIFVFGVVAFPLLVFMTVYVAVTNPISLLICIAFMWGGYRLLRWPFRYAKRQELAFAARLRADSERRLASWLPSEHKEA